MIVLCGKTCSGKNYIRDALAEAGIEPVVTYTTRPPREGEIDGKTYNFLDREDFEQKVKEGFFFESTSYLVASNERWFYGSRFEPTDENKVIILNPDGLKALDRERENLAVKPLVVFIDVDESVLWDRINKRGDNPLEAERRIIADREDFIPVPQMSDLVINNDGSRDIKDIVSEIKNSHELFLAGKEMRWKPKEETPEHTKPKDIELDK